MKQPRKKPAAAPLPAKPSNLPRISDRLAPSLVESALDCGRDVRPGRDQREDGWTPPRIAVFLNALAGTGVVADAARAAGMSLQSAYVLRNSAKGRAFHLAWRAALLIARRRVADELMSRALHGVVDIVVQDGIVSERHRYDNRLALALLTRLDRNVGAAEDDPAARIVAEEFEQFARIAARGGAGAAEFVGTRTRSGGEVELLERAENYGRYGAGHPTEIDVADLDLERRDEWTEEQRDRAERAGILPKPEDDLTEGGTYVVWRFPIDGGRPDSD